MGETPVGGLATDLYEIRMAASYLRRGMTDRATFSVFARKLPPDRGFLVAAGLDDVLTSLTEFGFTPGELAYLRDVAGLRASDVAALGELRFDGDVWAVPEGTMVFANEPLLEVTAPLPVAQLVETMVLNQVTFATTVASKAARCVLAAGDAAVVDFGARRTHGLAAAMTVARVGAMVGVAGTSYVEAARRFGLRPVGTMAHSYVQAYPSEREAFVAFAEDYPEDTVFLVDTYDTLAGVACAIDVARELGLASSTIGVRLDSGNLPVLATRARRMLDDAGMPGAIIVASGGLDEFAIADLAMAAAPIDVYGVGTKMGVSWDAPSLDSAYKLVAYAGRPVMKLSAGKATYPGAKQVFRGGSGVPDLLGLRDEPVPSGRRPLLVRVMADGVRTGQSTLTPRETYDHELAWLPASARRLRGPEPLAASPTPALRRLTDTVAAGLTTRTPART